MLEKAVCPKEQLVSLHGSAFTVRCTNSSCSFTMQNQSEQPTAPEKFLHGRTSITDEPSLRCKECQEGSLRPGVCWFGEELPARSLERVSEWFEGVSKADLILVVGTDRSPFVAEAQALGAETAWLNFFEEDLPDTGGDWYVDGDVSLTLPWLVDLALQ